MGWLITGLVALNGVSVGASFALRRRMRRAIKRADRSWREAARVAEVAAIQAQALGDCTRLLCDDCRSIAHGHYMLTAYPTVSAYLAEHGSSVEACDEQPPGEGRA